MPNELLMYTNVNDVDHQDKLETQTVCTIMLPCLLWLCGVPNWACHAMQALAREDQTIVECVAALHARLHHVTARVTALEHLRTQQCSSSSRPTEDTGVDVCTRKPWSYDVQLLTLDDYLDSDYSHHPTHGDASFTGVWDSARVRLSAGVKLLSVRCTRLVLCSNLQCQAVGAVSSNRVGRCVDVDAANF